MPLKCHIRIPMKKTTTKLELKKNTVRILQGSELSEVAGGAPTALCTNEGQTCSGSKDHCPHTTPFPGPTGCNH
jgi:hypothetical protein